MPAAAASSAPVRADRRRATSSSRRSARSTAWITLTLCDGRSHNATVFVNRMPRYDVLSEEAMATLEGGWRRLVSRDRDPVRLPQAHSGSVRRARTSCDEGVVRFDPDFLLEQVGEGARRVRRPGAQPGPRHRLRGRPHGVRRRGRRAVRARRRPAARWDAGRPRAVRAARARLRRDRHHRADPVRAHRPAARLAPPRHGVRAADADGQGADVGAVRRRQDARLARDDGDRLRR